MAMFCIARYGLALHGTIWCLSKLSYIVIRQLGKQSAVLSSRHWVAKSIHSSQSEERVMAAWQIDFDRSRDADISGISHRGTDIVGTPSSAPAYYNFK